LKKLSVGRSCFYLHIKKNTKLLGKELEYGLYEAVLKFRALLVEDGLRYTVCLLRAFQIRKIKNLGKCCTFFDVSKMLITR
jgi:hypothetical protein